MDLSEWIREENSQCNYQAVDAQRFHERKTQEQQPSYIVQQDLYPEVHPQTISCSHPTLEASFGGSQSYLQASQLYVPR